MSTKGSSDAIGVLKYPGIDHDGWWWRYNSVNIPKAMEWCSLFFIYLYFGLSWVLVAARKVFSCSV